MEDDLYSFGNNLNTFIEKNQPNEAERFISQINKAFTESELPPFTIDTYMLNIFNESTGLLDFLKRVLHKPEFKKAKVKCFEFLFTLVNNCTNKVQKYLINIIKACSPVVRSSASAAEKQKSLELITLVIQKGNFYAGDQYDVDAEMADLYNSTLYKCLHCRFDKSSIVQEELLVVVGAVTKKFPSAIANPNELRSTLINQLYRELQKSTKSFPVITGCVTALSNYLENFPFDPTSDKSTADTIYKCVKLLADPGDASRRVAYRESLSLVSKHMFLFKNALYSEAKWWHRTLLKWFNLGVDDKKAAYGILETFYQEMANILSIKSEDNDSELFKHFIDYFLEVITKTSSGNDSSLENYEIRLAIRGFGLLARAFKSHITPQEINKTFITISQIMEHTYILNHKPEPDQIMYLPDYIQTLSYITKNLPQLNNTHIMCLQRVSILMIKIFPQIERVQHHLVIDAFVITSFQLLQCKNNALEIFLEDVVYQGVLWTCSHAIAVDAELYRDDNKQVITYKNYMSLWNGYLSITNAMKYEKYEINIKTRKAIVRKLLDELIKTLFVLINKLNLNTKLKDVDQPITDPGMAYEAVQTNDFVIFVNIVDFYEDVLERVEPEIFKKWIIMYINQVIIKSIKNPLVSGFYKLLAACLKICDKINYFEDSELASKEDLDACCKSVCKFLQEVLWKMKQFKGDLQIACLHVILAAPVCLIKDILPCAAPAFVVLFTVGRSYLKLADLGVDTLEKWLKHLPLNDFAPFLKEVLPSLDSYLKSRSLGGSITSDLALKTRKTKQRIEKRKVLIQTEPELFKLQIKILTFIGQLNSNLCISFVNSGNNIESVVWNKTPYLKITLPYSNTKLNLYLDKFVPRIVELALYSSDRKIRMAACELLHGVIMIMLGISHPLEPSKLKDLDGLMKAVVKPVIKLGCDMDEMVQQLYSPLALQLMRYYSHPRQMKSSHTQIVVETLIEAISNPSDSSLRDFAGSCIKEFITWTIKQANEEDLRKNSINIKVWIRTIQSFSVHPDPFKRLGAALIFNNIYTILREEISMFSMFWLEILCAFVINLSLTQVNNVDDNNCIEQVSQALNHVQRGFVEKYKIFNKADGERRKPPGLEGSVLKDVVMWLLKETGSDSACCRQKCMTMFCKIAPLVTNCNNSLNRFKELYLGDDLEWITLTYEKELIRNPTLKDLQNCESTNDLFQWMHGLLCALEGYIFVITNNLIPTDFTSKKSKFFISLRFFLECVQSQSIQEVLSVMPGNENLLHTVAEKESFNNLKSVIVTKIIELSTILVKDIVNFTYVVATPASFWGNSLWDLICYCIFDAQVLGFDITKNCEHHEMLLNLLNQINEYSSAEILNSLTNSLSAYIINKFVADADVGFNLISIKQRQLLTGMQLLQQSLISEKLNIKKYTAGTFKNLVNGLTENKNGEKIVKKLHKSAQHFCDLKLQLALEDEREFCELISFMCNPPKVKNNQNEEVLYGTYFFESFKDTITKYILKNYTLFFDTIFKLDAMNCAITYIIEILRCIYRNPKNAKQEVIQEIAQVSVKNWEKMSVHFDTTSREKLLGMEFIDKLAHIVTEPLHNLTKEKPAVVHWVISLFHFEDPQWSEEASLSFKSEIFTVLPYVIGPFNTCELELSNALKNLKEKYFSKGSKLNITHMTTFKKLLIAVKVSKSKVLFSYAADIYVTAAFDTKEIDLKYALKPFIRYASMENQVNSLKLVYEMCFDTTKFTPSQRYIVAKDVLPALVQNCYYTVFEQFYSGIISKILSILDRKNNPTGFSMIHIINKTIAYIYVELLFSRIKTEKFTDNSCLISKAAYPEDVPSDKKLLKILTLSTVEVCKENYSLSRQEEQEIFRLYQCHSYNALVSIISNTQKEITHYDKWLFSREDKQNKQDILWKNLIDVNKKYTFEIDFDKVPAMKKVVVNIRNDILAAKKNMDSDARTVKYVESQHLFKSTLSEDITRFDFSHSVLRSQSEQKKSENENIAARQEFQIVLESLDINKHECMATVCGLIQHLVESDISPLPTENEEVILPKWMKAIRNVMMTDSTHINVKIFLTKVIHNTQSVFKPYAKWFFAPLIKVIVDGCIGKTINFFIADIVVMMTSWSSVAIPNDDKVLASNLLKFLMENVDSDRRDVFKYNLEQIKLVVETWKQCLEFPHDLLYTKLQLEETSKKLDVGIHLIAVLLANNIVPWKPTEVKNFLMTLSKVLKSEHRTVYQPCAEVLGMSLQCMSTDADATPHLHKFTEYLHKQLTKLTSNDDKFAYCLQGLVLHYPVIADKYLSMLVSKLSHVSGNFKCIYLKIFLARVEILHTLNELSSIDFQKLLSEENFEAQVLTLEIIEKSIGYLRSAQLTSVLKNVSKFVNNSFTLCRIAMYDIFITTYNIHFSKANEASQEITAMCKDVLLQGLVDTESTIQDKIQGFWSNENNLPIEIPKIFLFLLNTMYKPSIEEHYVSYSTYLLLNVLKSTEEFSEKLFEYVLSECDFQDYNLICNWRRQHASIAPLFADTLRSQESSINPMNPNVLRATVSTLEFQPTQMTGVSSTHSSKYFTNPSSSLLFSIDDEGKKQSVFKDPNYVLPKVGSIKSRRFLRDKSKVSRHFAYLEARKSIKAEELRKERVKRSERDVTVYRKYRIGDYPDIEITLSSIITPLQVLIRCDATLARCLYTAVFQSLVNKMQKDNKEDDAFIQSVNLSINNIFNNSTQFVPTTIGTFLDIALIHKNTMRFHPNTVSSVCQASGLLSVGSLLLEEYLISGVEDVTPAKRSRGVETENTMHWVKFAELYKEMDEWDVVSAVFMEKMNCDEVVLNAIDAESTGQWRSAQDFYAQVVEKDSSLERKDFYYESYFKCFAALAEWDKLSNVIEQTVATDNKSNIWTSLWDKDWNQEKLLPWYITAELRNILSGMDQKLFAAINEFLTDPEKSEYLKLNFGEELAVLCLLQNDVDTADYYLNHSVTDFLENWSHLNPLFVKLRAKKVLNLRNMVEICVFIKLFNKINIDNQENILENLLKSWQDTLCDSVEPLLSSETRTVYRNQFISVLKTKLHSILDADDVQTVDKNFNKCKFNIHMNLVENALQQGNYYVARKYIKLSARPNPNDQVQNMQWSLALSKILFLRAQMLENNEEKLSLMLDSWSKIGVSNMSSTEDNALCYLIKSKEHTYHLTQEIYKIISSNDQLFNEKQAKLQRLMGNLPLDSADAVWHFGVKDLQNSLNFCENDIQNMMDSDNLKVYAHLASAYVKLAYCVQNKGNEFEDNFILYVLRATKLGSVEGKQLFPYLLDKDIGVTHKDTFLKESSEIPTWMYLGWLPQLLANLDSSNIFVIADIVLKIAKIYPQAVMYPYRLSRKMYKFKDNDIGSKGKEITESLDEMLLCDDLIDKFLKAMSYVTSPTNVLRYHISKLLRASCTSKEQFGKAYQNLCDELYSEIPDYRNAKSLQGAMFKKIKKYEAPLKNLFKARFDANNYQKTLRALDEEVKGLKYDRSVKLVDYSPWLANYQATELHANLEIPGQYTGEKRPLVQYHIKMMGFSPLLMLLKSLRAPMRITILGNDGKEYHYLNKFGEDLRQDQRIEQIFNLMNKILLHDPDCSKRQLSICTYQVVPLNSRLGIIEWINKTKELKDFVEDGIEDQLEKLNYTNSYQDYCTWIDQATPRGLKNKVTEAEKYGLACRTYTRNVAIVKYGAFVNSLSLDVLRKSFWNVSVNSESFFALRHKFATSYAVICISHWLLGIGDRHLSNTLISLCSGEAIGIDFGHAFGTATQILPVPELVPFRLTPHILNLLQPMNEHGLLQESMIYCLRAFRKNKDILLTIMNVFIKEPSLDWLEFARRSEITSLRSVTQEWYPNQKIEHAQRKLQGANSTSIMIEELEAGHSHAQDAQFLKAYIDVVKGTREHNFRARKGDDLSEEDQVKCLLDHATDYNLLGRMYAGWQAWV